MTIETDIITWALERPGWQQEILVALANGAGFDDTTIENLADTVLLADSGMPSQEAKSISIKSNMVEQVQLKEITSAQGVNALIDGQTLSLGQLGLTVIYGDNGSGKSGYARLIKSMVSTRHTASVLPDVFKESPPSPTAQLIYTVAGVDKTQSYPSNATSDMLKMSFYDEYCGDEYLTKQSTISYRPSVLILLDGLIEVCDRVRAALQGRIANNQASALNLGLTAQTTAGAFALGITGKTSNDQIEKATQLAPETNGPLSDALQEEARLKGSNPAQEKTRLTSLALQFRNLSAGISTLLSELTEARSDERVALKSKAGQLRSAADLASTKSFDAEPLAGVGSETWRALWMAARQYSTGEAYHEHDFPETGDESVCVLCQQPLQESTKDRLQRFERAMADTTERDALAAEAAYAASVQELQQLIVMSPQRSATITTLTGLDGKLGGAVEALIATIDEYRDASVSHLQTDAPLPVRLPAVDILVKIDHLARKLEGDAQALDVTQFHIKLAAVTKQKEELQANVRLCESVVALKTEVTRLQSLALLQAAKSATDTNAITQKSSQLTRQYATKRILDQFTRETDRLKLERVTLKDLGGRKGQLNQKPGLLGANHREASARAVLSEGEQTALGLAGFFTESVFDDSKSAIIFDDPVTSLDHVRRGHVAARLAQLSKDRQVIVFTHDVAFVGDLSKAASHEGIAMAERAIERRGSNPGVCLNTFPWKAKDFNSRIDALRIDLQKLTKERATLETSAYEERVASWAGRLSETWERSVSSEIVDQVFDRGRSEVRALKFRLFAGITEQDNKDFEEGYGSTSKWSRRHDKAPTTNYVAPEPDQLAVELQRIVDWQKRMKGYVK